MISRLHQDRSTTGLMSSGPEPGTSEPSRIGAWIALLVTALDVPKGDRESIRAELQEHFEDRIHDLLVGGLTEADASEKAIAEFGEATDVARRFVQAHRNVRRRRLVMHASMLGIGVGATALGMMMFTGHSNQVPMAVYQDRAAEIQPPESFTETRVELTAETSLSDYFQYIELVTEKVVLANWADMETHDITPNLPIGVDLRNVTLPESMNIIVRQLKPIEEFQWRFHPRYIEFAFQCDLEFRERELVAYSLEAILDGIATEADLTIENAREELQDLLYTMVSPDDWLDNGGTLGELRFVGGKMFVEAPQRMHDRIRWILEQFSSELTEERAEVDFTR